MDNRKNNTEKRGDVLVGYAGIRGCVSGSVYIFPKAKECPATEPKREYTYKDEDGLEAYYDSL